MPSPDGTIGKPLRRFQEYPGFFGARLLPGRPPRELRWPDRRESCWHRQRYGRVRVRRELAPGRAAKLSRAWRRFVARQIALRETADQRSLDKARNGPDPT